MTNRPLVSYKHKNVESQACVLLLTHQTILKHLAKKLEWPEFVEIFFSLLCLIQSAQKMRRIPLDYTKNNRRLRLKIKKQHNFVLLF